MNTRILILILSIFSHSVFGQLILDYDQRGTDYFLAGNKCIELSEYNKADSLYTLALNTYRNADVYYNRAISRAFLNDTNGFCNDVNLASLKYFDKKSDMLYHEICCKEIDTFYLDKYLQKIERGYHKFYEVVKTETRTNIVSGTIYTTKDKSKKSYYNNVDYGLFDYDLEFIVTNKRISTNVIGRYRLIDSEKYFYLTENPPIINYKVYTSIEENATLIFKGKYSNLDNYNPNNEYIVYKLFIDSEGLIQDIELVEFSLSDDLEYYKNEIEQELNTLFTPYPKVYPGTLKKNYVNCILIKSINF